MKDFYEKFYTVTEHSAAHHLFCERVYGKDLCQHGFADMAQLDLLMQVAKLGPGQQALDLGCGNGMITETLSDATGAHFMGLDFIPLAIEQAQSRTAAKLDRLSFVVGDIHHLELHAGCFDVILSIDSIYFSEDYSATVRALKEALRPGGQMLFLYSHGREPWVPVEQFPKEALPADKTPLAEALRANGMSFRTWDLTAQDYALAQRRREVLTELRAQFEQDEAQFIYDNRMGDAQGISQAVEQGLHRRYLYQARIAETGGVASR